MSSFALIIYIASYALSLLPVDAVGVVQVTKTHVQESLRGYLVDAVCLKEEAAQLAQLGPKHTKKCLQMPACRRSGYALLVFPGNDVLRFDKRGNDLAAKLVDAHRRESGWLLQVTGKRTGDEFAVTTLELAPASSRERRSN